jgi:transposase
VIDYETYCKIKDAHDRQGLTIAQCARALGLHRDTVAKWVGLAQYRPRIPVRRTSRLDPFKARIVRLLETHPYSAQQIFQRLREEGFTGGATIVKDYVRKVRPPRREAFLKLSFVPGECAQIDWGEYGTIAVGNTRRRLSFFLMVLCYSRMMYLEFTVSQTMEHFLACHEHAFAAFAGCPARLMIDNLKSAVLRRVVGEAPMFNPRYLDFARHWGFDISPCTPRKGNEKENAPYCTSCVICGGTCLVRHGFVGGLVLMLVLPRRVGAGSFEQILGLVIIAVRLEQPGASPAIDGGLAHVEALGDLGDGHQSTRAQPVVAAHQPVVDSNPTHHQAMKRLTFAREDAVVIESLRNFGIGVILEKPIDLGYGADRCLPQLPGRAG